MALTRFTESGLYTLCRHLEIKILNLYYGSYTRSFKVSYPWYRLVFVFESDGKSYFGDSVKDIPCVAGRWYLLPPFCEVDFCAIIALSTITISPSNPSINSIAFEQSAAVPLVISALTGKPLSFTATWTFVLM